MRRIEKKLREWSGGALDSGGGRARSSCGGLWDRHSGRPSAIATLQVTSDPFHVTHDLRSSLRVVLHLLVEVQSVAGGDLETSLPRRQVDPGQSRRGAHVPVTA